MSTAAEIAAMEAYPYENSGDPTLVELAEAFEKGWYAKPDLTVTTEQIEAAHRQVQREHGKSGSARDAALLRALGVKVEEV